MEKNAHDKDSIKDLTFENFPWKPFNEYKRWST